MKKLFFVCCFLLTLGSSVIANSVEARQYFYGTYHDVDSGCDYNYQGYWDDNGGFHIYWDGPCGGGQYDGIRPSTGAEPASTWSDAETAYEIGDLIGDTPDLEAVALEVFNDAASTTDF